MAATANHEHAGAFLSHKAGIRGLEEAPINILRSQYPVAPSDSEAWRALGVDSRRKPKEERFELR
jgi:hypothetical protein